MKELVALIAIFHIICMVVAKEVDWQQECIKEREKGNTCGVSRWDCKGNSEKQSMKITHPDGTAAYKWHSRTPCRGDGGGEKGRRCGGKDDGCCTKENPCNAGDGDCDNDEDCVGSLVCGKDNCPWGDQDDCCHKAGGEECKDVQKVATCEYYKELGYCTESFVGFMKRNCCKTCKEKGKGKKKQDSWQVECENERKKGNICELSGWICNKKWEKQTMKITHPDGSLFRKNRNRSPCRKDVRT